MAPVRSSSRTRAAATLRQPVYVNGFSGSSSSGLPRLDRRRLVVEAVVRLAEAEQRGARDRRVIEPDHAREVPACLREIARGQEVVAALDELEGRVAGQSPPTLGPDMPGCAPFSLMLRTVQERAGAVGRLELGLGRAPH